jgi:radical SAM superfamily enzyme YgiQ (UPF0313 family)
MDIIFINPSKSKNKKDHIVNMSLFWLVSVLHDEGISSKIYTVLGDDFENEIVRIIDESNPKWVGISCKWWNTLYTSIEISRVLKMLYPQIKIFTGGHTASIFAKDLIEKNYFDFVLLGDTEKTIIDFYRQTSKLGTASKNGFFSNEISLRSGDYLKSYSLVGIDKFIDRPDLIMGYVWTGRGCFHDCFYCAENTSTTKKIFNKRIPFVRNVASVVSDILKFGERTYIIFDYEYPSFDETDSYIEELLLNLPDFVDYRCYFFSWGLPSKKLIDLFSTRFSYSSLCIDVQCYSESLRKLLSDKKLTKPFFSNNQLLNILNYVDTKDNVLIDASGIVGYPFETDDHREEGLEFINYIHSKYKCVRDVRPSPLHVIPGTPMTENDKYFNLTVVRKSFDDFLTFTKESFEESLSYYSVNRKSHPFGVYPDNKPLVIVEYMQRINSQLQKLREQKTSVIFECINHNTYKLFIEDLYSPLETLAKTLNNFVLNEGENMNLIISLGYCTFFHNSWIDYTSESGENCTSILEQNDRDSVLLKKRLLDTLNQFINIELENKNSSAWGVIGNLVKETYYEN